MKISISSIKDQSLDIIAEGISQALGTRHWALRHSALGAHHGLNPRRVADQLVYFDDKYSKPFERLKQRVPENRALSTEHSALSTKHRALSTEH